MEELKMSKKDKALWDKCRKEVEERLGFKK